MRWMGLLVWTMALAACAASFPAVPSKGGPSWYELTSEHFTMWTDAEPGPASQLLREMERFRRGIAGAVFPTMSTGRILVFALRDDDELRLVQRPYEPPFALTTLPPLYQPAMVVSVFSDRWGFDARLPHELAHAVSYGVAREQPRWLAEGMATYFETMQYNLDHPWVDVGVTPLHFRRSWRIEQLLPVSILFAWKRDEAASLRSQFYDSAWALFSFLVNAHRAELVRYFEILDDPALAAPGGGPPRAVRAWEVAFASLPLTAVDDELRRWMVSGHHLVLHFEISPSDATATRRTLTDAEVHAIEGYLIADGGQQRDHVEAALRLEPTNVLAQLLLRLRQPGMPPSAAEGRATAAAHPDDWRAWWLAATALRRGGNATDASMAARRACVLIALNPAVSAPPDLCPSGSVQITSP